VPARWLFVPPGAQWCRGTRQAAVLEEGEHLGVIQRPGRHLTRVHVDSHHAVPVADPEPSIEVERSGLHVGQRRRAVGGDDDVLLVAAGDVPCETEARQHSFVLLEEWSFAPPRMMAISITERKDRIDAVRFRLYQNVWFDTVVLPRCRRPAGSGRLVLHFSGYRVNRELTRSANGTSGSGGQRRVGYPVKIIGSARMASGWVCSK
jgi:hypothetical protein